MKLTHPTNQPCKLWNMATSSESKDEDEGFILIIDDKCSISDSKSEQTDGFDSSPPPINEVSRNGLPNGDRLLKPLFPSSSSKSTGGSGPPQQLYRNLRQWIYCITVVNFDIEIGQSIEVSFSYIFRFLFRSNQFILQCIFPPDTHLTEREVNKVFFGFELWTKFYACLDFKHLLSFIPGFKLWLHVSDEQLICLRFNW